MRAARCATTGSAATARGHDARRSSTASWTTSSGAPSRTSTSRAASRRRATTCRRWWRCSSSGCPGCGRSASTRPGLTPHRAIPMLTRIVKFCAAHDLPISIRVSLDGIGDIHNQVRQREARLRQGAARPIEAMQALAAEHPNFQFGIAATIFATNLEDAKNILDLGARARSSTSSSTCCGSPTTCSATGACRRRSASRRRKRSSCGSSSWSASRRSRCCRARRSCTCTTPT